MNKKEFTTKFTMIKNPFSDYASEGGICYQPEGEELGFVRGHDPSCVWTKVIGFDGCVWLRSGYHYEDRVSFILTEQPIPPDTYVEVKWEDTC